MILRGRERGYVTCDEINRAIPPESVPYDQIEDLMARLIELGIAVVDSGEAGGNP
jgi:RNA polymerase primary sigma factor